VQLWTRVTETASRENLNVALWLGQGKPTALENNAIVLEFSHEHRNARDYLERSENRGLVEKILQAVSVNLTSYQTVLKAATAPRRTETETKPALRLAAEVSPELAEKVLEDPHIAKVVDIFKGRIVEVKHHAKEVSKPTP